METDSLTVAEDLLRRLEGLRLAPYRDVAGLWTIGYGNRCMADGSPVTATTRPITADAAMALLRGTLVILRGKLRTMLTVSLSPCREGAVLSWQYNVGTSAAASSTLLRLLNAGAIGSAANQFALWNKVRDPATGRLVVSSGLVNRRAIERAAFLGQFPGAGAMPVPAEPAGTPAHLPALSTDSLNAAELDRVKG